jgi:hypothetical protein
MRFNPILGMPDEVQIDVTELVHMVVDGYWLCTWEAGLVWRSYQAASFSSYRVIFAVLSRMWFCGMTGTSPAVNAPCTTTTTTTTTAATTATPMAPSSIEAQRIFPPTILAAAMEIQAEELQTSEIKGWQPAQLARQAVVLQQARQAAVLQQARQVAVLQQAHSNNIAAAMNVPTMNPAMTNNNVSPALIVDQYWEPKWEVMLETLKGCKWKYGSCDIPNRVDFLEEEYFELRDWVLYVRGRLQDYRIDPSTAPCLYPSRIHQLMDIGFLVVEELKSSAVLKRRTFQRRWNRTWKRMVEKLKVYKEMYGNCDVPTELNW